MGRQSFWKTYLGGGQTSCEDGVNRHLSQPDHMSDRMFWRVDQTERERDKCESVNVQRRRRIPAV
jgi:Uri superfamily endonuclease